MKKSLKSEIAKLKDNKLIAQKSYVTEMETSLQKEDETLTQLKRAMYGKGLSPLPVIAKEFERVIAIAM